MKKLLVIVVSAALLFLTSGGAQGSQPYGQADPKITDALAQYNVLTLQDHSDNEYHYNFPGNLPAPNTTDYSIQQIPLDAGGTIVGIFLKHKNGTHGYGIAIDLALVGRPAVVLLYRELSGNEVTKSLDFIYKDGNPIPATGAATEKFLKDYVESRKNGSL